MRADPTQYLESDDEDVQGVRTVRVDDRGSKPQVAVVDVQGVPTEGIIDTGSDITIMGAELFKKVAAVAHLKKSQLKRPDKVPYMYDHQTFKLDGKLELDITFQDQTMLTPVYLKMDAHDSLLLSEGVCRQLKIVTYHPSIEVWQASKKSASVVPCIQATPDAPGGTSTSSVPGEETPTSSAPKVGSVRVKLVKATRILPQKSQLVTIQVEQESDLEQEQGLDQVLLMEPSSEFAEEDCGLCFRELLVKLSPEGRAQVPLANFTGMTQKLEEGSYIGNAVGATVVAEHDNPAFAVEDGECGSTDLIEMSIETGDATPVRQPLRRTPFAARQEVAEQLVKMQSQGIIRSSTSPWASPVVLVRKKDGSLWFCVDYRGLNAVTKTDQFPLPRIDDLLDLLGKAKYFSTLDLSSGYWQVKMQPDSKEKTAFATYQGLYEFNVMPFGLKNAPAVFQRLMQRVLMDLNPEDGPAFVSTYIDDVLVFSSTFEEHLIHISHVLDRLIQVRLKLKPSKCHFICREVEYLGHLITPHGILPNPRRIVAVREYPIPKSVKEVRQFLGIASYYRRFVQGFAKVAQPLHALTQKGAVFSWTQSCQGAFNKLTNLLVEAPVLVHPDFDKPFTLETDARDS